MTINQLSPLLFVCAIGTIAGCIPAERSTGRYHVEVEKIPEGTVTHLVDSEHNKEVLYIAELEGNSPAINLFPVSLLDVESVSIESLGRERVLIGHREKSDENTYHLLVSAESNDNVVALSSQDRDKDGYSDVRALRMGTISSYFEYMDLDANGKLDAQVESNPGATPRQQLHILVGPTWVPVEGDKEVLLKQPYIATTKSEPQDEYHFQDGAWHKTDIPATPQ